MVNVINPGLPPENFGLHMLYKSLQSEVCIHVKSVKIKHQRSINSAAFQTRSKMVLNVFLNLQVFVCLE